jgi:multidrug efflux pump subunit AcrA (membrane-fusion protein)
MKTIISHNKKTIRNFIIGILMLLLTAFSFSSCEKIKGIFGKGKDGKNAPEAPVFAVNTTQAAQGQIRDYIALSGDIVAGSTVDAYSDAAGKVTQIFVSAGNWVNRGDRIASVDPSRPGMSFRESIVTSPISGTVVAIPAQVGMTISQAVPLARISGGGALEIRLHVAERFISRMAMNLPCEITLDAWPGDVFQGSISEISPTVDPASRTMEVKINVNNAGSKLKAGMFAKVRVVTERKNNIVKIPAAAMINRFGEQYVYTVEKDSSNPEFNVVRKRIIKPGILIDGILEVTGGLAPDEEIVVRGQTLLDDGARVNIIERIAPLGDSPLGDAPLGNAPLAAN